MLETWLSWDRAAFVWINQKAIAPALDVFFPFITDAHHNQLVRILALIALVFWVWRERSYALRVLAVAAISIAAADVLAYRVLKPWAERPRPSQVAELNAIVRQNHPPIGYSFPSNHSINNFAGATALAFYYPPLSPLFYLYASLVAYSRVYVGAHYPGDVMGGALLGWLVTMILIRVFFSRWPRFVRRIRGPR